MSFSSSELDPRSDANKLRRFEDAALISHPNRWEVNKMNLVSQPWRTAELGRVVHATMHPNVPLTVFEVDAEVKHSYRTVEALVFDWRID